MGKAACFYIIQELSNANRISAARMKYSGFCRNMLTKVALCVINQVLGNEADSYGRVNIYI